MKFYYLIPAYNEEAILAEVVKELEIIPQKYPGSEVLLLDNGSSDGSWTLMQQLAKKNPSWLFCYHDDEKGMGVAYQRGMREVAKRNPDAQSWIIFTAADLPFGFSDLESLLAQTTDKLKNTVLFVGSKRHPQSQVQRGWKRILGSWIFEICRYLILRIKTKDTQGTLFLRGDRVGMVEKLTSKDYFLSCELVYHCEKAGGVIEMPVVLKVEKRSSKVSVIKDGIKSLKQLWRLRRS